MKLYRRSCMYALTLAALLLTACGEESDPIETAEQELGGVNCYAGPGWYCGDLIGMDPKTVYQCAVNSAGDYYIANSYRCENSCKYGDPGENDYCV